MMNEQKQDFETLMQDIYYNFRFYIYLKRKIHKNGNVERYIEEVAEIDEKGKKNTIYLRKNQEACSLPWPWRDRALGPAGLFSLEGGSDAWFNQPSFLVSAGFWS